MLIDRQHPTLTLSQAVQDFAQPFFDKYHLNYFQYLTVFKDGSFSLACNHIKWNTFIFDHFNKVDKPFIYSHLHQTEPLTKNSYYFLWEPNLPEYPVKLAREFNIANGLCFVERFADRYHLIAFATEVYQPNAVDTYLNHIQDLQNFIQQFRHNQKKLIQTVDDNRIIVPESKQDANLSKMLLAQKKFLIEYNAIKSHITFQEYACLKQLAKNQSYKAIAQQLNISPRTVETYLQRVKHRYSINSTHELLQLFQKI